MSSSTSLDAATQERKVRLAQLKSLKRKQPPRDEEVPDAESTLRSPPTPRSRSRSPDIASTILSGRNYDTLERGPKLGFENAPHTNLSTVESQAAELANAAKLQADKDAQDDKPLDLFKLQPKKPNWDLKRDLEKKLEILNVRTDNAVARLVRERILKAQNEAKEKAKANGKIELNGDGEAETVGMDGAALVEAMHVREREEQEDEKRERDMEDNEDED